MKIIKKIFKVLSVLVIIVILCIVMYIGFVFISKKIQLLKENNERINNSKTLSQYITNHDSEHLHCGSCGQLRFLLEDFKCDDIKDKEIIYLDNNILVLNDYTIYEILLYEDKLYSNNQQCKKIDTKNVKIDGLVSYTPHSTYFKSNDSIYGYKTRDTFEEHKTFSEIGKYDLSFGTLNIMKNNYKIINFEGYKYYAIKDGNIYTLTLNDNYEIETKEIFMSKDDYGYIRDAIMDIEIESGNTFKSIEKQITQLITDKGIYILKEKKEQDCEKYVDVSCDYELVLSDIYSKYSKDIKYIGNEITILNDNNIIETSIFYNELDKEVK